MVSNHSAQSVHCGLGYANLFHLERDFSAKKMVLKFNLNLLLFKNSMLGENNNGLKSWLCFLDDRGQVGVVES